jgi:hypothetical protein
MGLRLDSGFPERIRQREGKGLLQTKAPIEESRKRIWLVDSKVVESMISFHVKY